VITRFTIHEFEELMLLMNDFRESLEMWGKESTNNTWDMEVYIGDGEYYIDISINENKNKSK
jgi:hypothetical protein